MEPFKVFIGFDPREADAYRVAERSIRMNSSIPLDVQPLIMERLQKNGLYSRPTERKDGRLWDVISDAPMSTEFALTRFLVPALTGYKGWALFLDCDFLFRKDVMDLFALRDEDFALMCVQHDHIAHEIEKMDGQRQTNYFKKNWSSLVLWNCKHLYHAGQIERVERWPGLWLHQFCWLPPLAIGPLPKRWNWLEGVSEPDEDPAAVHYTRGIPSMRGYENSAFADEWRALARG